MGAGLGIDFGEKRIGVAVSDELGIVANPLVTLIFRGRKALLQELTPIFSEYKIEVVVVGLPKTLVGDIGIAGTKIAKHVEWLEQNTKLKWVLWDERLSTAEVERGLIAADVSRKRRKEVRDQLAAQRILQSYLDAHRASP